MTASLLVIATEKNEKRVAEEFLFSEDKWLTPAVF